VTSQLHRARTGSSSSWPTPAAYPARYMGIPAWAWKTAAIMWCPRRRTGARPTSPTTRPRAWSSCRLGSRRPPASRSRADGPIRAGRTSWRWPAQRLRSRGHPAVLWHRRRCHPRHGDGPPHHGLPGVPRGLRMQSLTGGAAGSPRWTPAAAPAIGSSTRWTHRCDPPVTGPSSTRPRPTSASRPSCRSPWTGRTPRWSPDSSAA